MFRNRALLTYSARYQEKRRVGGSRSGTDLLSACIEEARWNHQREEYLLFFVLFAY
jgi:hypothetical protein